MADKQFATWLGERSALTAGVATGDQFPVVRSGVVYKASASNLPSQITLNVAASPYNADSTGLVASNAAFANVMLAAKAAIALPVDGVSSDRKGNVVIEIPPGEYLITDPLSFMGDEAMTQKAIGLKFRGAGKGITRIVFAPSTSGDFAHCAFWLAVHFEGISFVATTAGCTFLYCNAVNNEQDNVYVDCDWWGWKYIEHLAGTDNNSEHTFERCSTSAMSNNGAWLYIPSANAVDQFLNYRWYSCKHWSTSAPIIDAAKGGHFYIHGMDCSNWGGTSPQKLINLRGNNHSQGVCMLSVSGLRVEAMHASAGLLFSEWPQGVVLFDAVDWSSQTPTYTYGDIIELTLDYSGPGPIYTFRSCVLAGGIKINLPNEAWRVNHEIVVENCQWFQKLSPSDVVTYVSYTGQETTLSRPVVNFKSCKGATTDPYTAPGLATWDASIGCLASMQFDLKERYLSLRAAGGANSSTGMYNDMYAILPVGAMITGMRAVGGPGGTGEADGGSWVLQTSEGSPTTVVTITVAGAMSAGFGVDATPTVPYLCDSDLKRKLKLTTSGIAGNNPNANVMIRGYW